MLLAPYRLVALAALFTLFLVLGRPLRAQPVDLTPGSQAIGSFGYGSTPASGFRGRALTSALAPGQAYVETGTQLITRSLRPGHWALQGARSVWVPPETVLRRVQSVALIQGRYVWRNGAYVWVPTHYAY